MVKNPPSNAGDVGSIPGLGRFLGKGNGKPTPVFLPGEFYGQRSLAGYSPWSHKRVRHNLVAEQKDVVNNFYSSHLEIHRVTVGRARASSLAWC